MSKSTKSVQDHLKSSKHWLEGHSKNHVRMSCKNTKEYDEYVKHYQENLTEEQFMRVEFRLDRR